jgi:hypothetical protein
LKAYPPPRRKSSSRSAIPASSRVAGC